jgi:hypothetical protein
MKIFLHPVTRGRIMTEASRLALEGLRDLHMIKWYAVPLLSVTLYIWTKEIHQARRNGNWDAIFAGLTLFGMDFVNETWNGLVFHFTQRSALWTTPGDTALRTMMGWNIEIMFMFAIAGIVYYYSLSPDPKEKILGLPNKWFWAIAFSVFCVFIECLLNMGGHLVWEYEYWNLSFKGVWLIFLFGYFHFFVAIIVVLGLKTIKARVTAVSSLYAIAIAANLICMGLLGWKY